MREVLLVSISALLGYIVFSAFSSTSTSEKALDRILNQPHMDVATTQKLAIQEQKNTQDSNIMKFDNENKKDQLEVYQSITNNAKDKDTEREIRGIVANESTTLATITERSKIEQKKQDNYTYLAMTFLLFLIVLLYLRYQKHLTQMELNQKSEQNELIAKKEYAEKILSLLASGNLTFETERRLLKVLDELNGHHIEKKPDIIYHPNPEIAQINNS